jgi:hypothetical protein
MSHLFVSKFLSFASDERDKNLSNTITATVFECGHVMHQLLFVGVKKWN